jgi:hypothetical protein
MLAVASKSLADKGFQMFVATATVKQVSFIKSLISERSYSGEVDFGSLTSREASNLISTLLAMPKANTASPVVPVTEVGMYQLANGAIYRVKPTRQSGYLYAMRLNIEGGFDYEQGAIRKISATDKMTLEQAQAFGVATGLCCVCGAFLTDPKSVAQGIGPVCASRF